jgi:hypothetical protein
MTALSHRLITGIDPRQSTDSDRPGTETVSTRFMRFTGTDFIVAAPAMKSGSRNTCAWPFIVIVGIEAIRLFAVS